MKTFLTWHLINGSTGVAGWSCHRSNLLSFKNGVIDQMWFDLGFYFHFLIISTYLLCHYFGAFMDNYSFWLKEEMLHKSTLNEVPIYLIYGVFNIVLLLSLVCWLPQFKCYFWKIGKASTPDKPKPLEKAGRKVTGLSSVSSRWPDCRRRNPGAGSAFFHCCFVEVTQF